MKFTIAKNGDVLQVAMRGDFDEGLEAHLAALAAKIETTSVIFDAEKVELINSLGARHWIGFVLGLTKRQIHSSFERCSPAFVEACTLYPKFVPSKSMKSLMMPVECDCGYQGHAILTENEWSQTNVLNGCACPKCSGVLHPTVDPDDFLQSVKG